MKTDHFINLRSKRGMVCASTLLLILSSCLFSCRQEKSDSLHQPAIELYKGCMELVKNFTDSMFLAKDSASLIKSNEKYEDLITRLNMRYPAEVGLHISEGENDTLTNLIERYINIRDSLLVAFSKNRYATDSLAVDSIPRPIVRKPVTTIVQDETLSSTPPTAKTDTLTSVP